MIEPDEWQSDCGTVGFGWEALGEHQEACDDGCGRGAAP